MTGKALMCAATGVLLALAACGGSSESGTTTAPATTQEPATTQPSTTTQAPTTTQAAPTSSPSATLTDDGCAYEGPDTFGLDSEVTFLISNGSTSTEVGFAIWRFPSGVTPEDIFIQGIFGATGADDALVTSSSRPFGIGATRELPVTFDAAGNWGINCFFFTPDASPGNDYATMFTVEE